MIGFPKTLNTKEDYLNCLAIYETETKEALQRLLDARFIWVDTGIINDEENAIPKVDETHKIIADEEKKELHQYELQEDANAELYRLGFTVEEVEELLNK